MRQRYRITVRGATTELRGYVDGLEAVQALAKKLEPEGWMVIASPADSGFNPFAKENA